MSVDEIAIALTSEQIAEDLNNASQDDVIFNEKVFKQLFNEELNHNTSSSPAVEECFENLCGFLKKQEELKEMIVKLKKGSLTLDKMKEDVCGMMEQLQDNAQNINSAK